MRCQPRRTGNRFEGNAVYQTQSSAPGPIPASPPARRFNATMTDHEPGQRAIRGVCQPGPGSSPSRAKPSSCPPNSFWSLPNLLTPPFPSRSPGNEPVTLSRRDIGELLSQHGLAPRREFGQNFVGDPNTVRRIARLAGSRPGDHVVEIGAGLGSLTTRAGRDRGQRHRQSKLTAASCRYCALSWPTRPERHRGRRRCPGA